MWILATVLGLILFFALLLAIPIDLRFRVEREESLRSQARAEWMFGLVGIDLKRKKEPPKPKKKKKKKKKSRRHVRPLLAMVRSSGFVRRVVKLINDIRKVIDIRNLYLDITAGLGDPGATGIVFAAVAPALVITNNLSPVDIRVRPDFLNATLKGYFSGDVRLVPIRLFKPVFLFMFSPVTIRAVKSMVAAYRK